MGFLIVIRGPAGVGKSTVAKLLSSELGAEYVSFDEVMKEHGLDEIIGDGIPAKNFLKANKLILNMTDAAIQSGKEVILDGCFYREEQIEHLKSHTKMPLLIFSLEAPLVECLARNAKRQHPLGETQVRAVYALVAKLPVGRRILTSGKNVTEIVGKLKTQISRQKIRNG